MQVNIRETEWRVTREPGAAAGAIGPDNRYPMPNQPGLRFTSSDGQSRFLPLPTSKLPSDTELGSIPLSQIIEWFTASRTEGGST